MIHPPGKMRMMTLISVVVLGFGVTAIAADADFPSMVKRLQFEKATFAKRQQDLLNQRYDLADRPAEGVTMSRGKPVQEGVRVKLLTGMTWEKLVAMSPDEIKAKGVFPPGFMRLEDTVEFINIVLGLQLTAQETSDLVAFMRAL